MSELNAHQKAAVYYVNGPLLILGGAGSGKTSLLARKIAWLIQEYSVTPARIVTLTSSGRAARSLRTQVANQVGGRRIEGITVQSWTAFGLTLVNEERAQLGLRPGFSIYGMEESRAVLARLMRTHAVPTLSVEAVRRRIADAKRARMDPVMRSDNDPVGTAAAELYPLYQARLTAHNAIDRDDLIARPVELLATRPEIRALLRARIDYLLVDDYEELTPGQHELVGLLIEAGCVLTAAGDDAQAIFSAGQAQVTALDRLRHDRPALRTFRLTQSYRLSGRILNAANVLIANNRPVAERALWCEREYGEPLRVLRARNETHEAERLVTALLDHKRRTNAEYRDFAILLADADDAGVFERALRAQHVPSYPGNRPAFYDRIEVKDALAYLRLLCNPADDVAFRRVLNTPRRNIDGATVAALERHAEESGVSLLAAALDPAFAPTAPIAAVTALREFSDWLRDLGERATHADPIPLACDLLAGLRYDDWLRDTCNDTKIAEQRMKNIMSLIERLQRIAHQRPHEHLGDVLARLNTVDTFDHEGDDSPGDAVTLLPIVAAKGLEFQHVYITGCEEGRLPRVPDTDRLLEERRRLYVAMTRARATLTFFHAEHRTRGGEVIACPPSRFLAELPPADLSWLDPEPPRQPASLSERAGEYLAQVRPDPDRR